jgi:hypothetical protein
MNLPVLSFFQPARNIAMQKALGMTVFCGPEVENWRALPPDVLAAKRAEWIKTTVDLGVKCILKAPAAGPLPANCVGVMLSVDEPNGKWPVPTTAADLKPESDDLRARYPGVKIYLSLAGDKILSLNPARPSEVQSYLDYATVADIFTIDFYSRNRDASRYPDTHPGDAVKKLITLTGKPVIPWLEHNDQQLKPIGGPNRAPTASEIQSQADWCLASGASGIGWFSTCEASKYGWGVTDPAKGDSFWPLIDRNGVSMQPQIDAVRRISLAMAPPPPEPAPPIEYATKEELAVVANEVSTQEGEIAELTRRLDAMVAAGAKPV